MSYPLTDEEYSLVMRNTPRGIINQPVDLTIDQQAEIEQEKKRRKKIEDNNAKLFAEQERLNKVIDENRVWAITGGKHLELKPGLEQTQCIFVDDKCMFCDKPIKRLDGAWAGWSVGLPGMPERDIQYSPHAVNESENYFVHHECEQTKEVQIRQIKFLLEEMKKVRKDIPGQILQAIWNNTVGR